jgi:phosphotransferase system HPr (HPr) family protein
MEGATAASGKAGQRGQSTRGKTSRSAIAGLVCSSHRARRVEHASRRKAHGGKKNNGGTDVGFARATGGAVRQSSEGVRLGEIVVVKGEREANAKSSLKIMTLGAKKGGSITIRVEGEDDEEAVEALAGLISMEE